MSFDRFLLAVESRNISQADKNVIRASFYVLRRKSWELSHVIFLKLKKK